VLLVWEAWRQVKANKGAPGVDGQALEEFEADLADNLYKIWNRMSSGSYFPPPVLAVEIPKPHGNGVRVLGVPTVADRVAQTVVAMFLEPMVEPRFHRDSYGYRPSESAHDALEACRARCWKYDWVIDLDIQKFFDEVPWDLIVRAVEAVTDAGWVLLYVERWLQAPLKHPNGALSARRELRRDRRFRRSWRTCSCTTRSMRGWPGSSRTARLSATPTMRSCTARHAGRRSTCWAGSPRGYKRLGSRCTPTRRGSSTARTATVAASTSTPRSRSWVRLPATEGAQRQDRGAVHLVLARDQPRGAQGRRRSAPQDADPPPH
jgi:Reverse transcriptase (RNA-dependent DNA polymerase)